MDKKRAYAYLRVSTRMQAEEGYSLMAQRTAITKYAEYAGFEILHWYTDEGISGTSIGARDQFKMMIRDIVSEKDTVDYVITYSLSRFGRNTADNVSTLQKLRDFKVNLYAIKEGIDSSSEMGGFLITILSAVAEMERETIRTQTMTGRFQKGRLGLWNGGITPYGYRAEQDTSVSLKNAKKLVIVEEEAAIIRKIFDLYVNTDLGFHGVAIWLNENGYKKNTNRVGAKKDFFTRDFVKNTLSRKIYTGNMYYGRTKTIKKKADRSKTQRIKSADEDIVVCENSHEAIIPMELFEKAAEKISVTSRKYERAEPDHVYILGPLVKCPECGGSMFGIGSRKKKQDGTRYAPSYSYLCRHARSVPPKCNYKRFFSAKRLEGEVSDIIIALCQDQVMIDEVTKQIEKEADAAEWRTKVRNLQRELMRLQNTQNTLERQLDSLDPDDAMYEKKYESYNRRLEEAFETISDLESRLQSTRATADALDRNAITAKSIYTLFKDFSQIYDKMSDQEKRTLMESFIEKVEVNPERVRGHYVKSIRFRFPITVDGEITREYSVPKSITDETACLLTRGG